jgi:predicted nuclease with TOPRIM domain
LRDVALEEIKQNQERFKSTIEELKKENNLLAQQAARDRAELNDASERNKDVLFQKRSLLTQTARARQLDLLLRRSETAQRFAEAKVARLEALSPQQVSNREMRLFSMEAGLIKLLGRVTLAVEILREEMGIGNGVIRSDRGIVELVGDKVSINK